MMMQYSQDSYKHGSGVKNHNQNSWIYGKSCLLNCVSVRPYQANIMTGHKGTGHRKKQGMVYS